MIAPAALVLVGLIHSGDALGPAPARIAQGVAEEKATKDDYQLDVSGTDAKVKIGKDAKFSLVIRPKAGRKVHPEAPLEVSFVEHKALRPAKPKLGRGDVSEKKATSPELRTTIRGAASGAHVLEAKVSFFLCTDAWCQRMTDRIAVPVSVDE